jgi:hypothetical protein
VSRFALHRQGQNSQVSTRCHALPCRGLVLRHTDSRKGFLPALNDRVCTLVTHGGCAATPKDEDDMTPSPSLAPVPGLVIAQRD